MDVDEIIAYNLKAKNEFLKKHGVKMTNKNKFVPIMKILPDFYVVKNNQKITKYEAVSNLYSCPKCHKKRTKPEEMQTRGLDEASSTRLECVECGNIWTIK